MGGPTKKPNWCDIAISPWAFPSDPAGMAWNAKVRPEDCIMAPPTPCTNRNRINCKTSWESPQRSEPMAITAMPKPYIL